METIIRAKKPFSVDFKELWSFRELFFTLAWRDIKVRYKQTAIGILWAILQPFILMVIFSFFFGKIDGLKPQDVPYPLFVFSGLLFWNLFTNILNGVANSMIANQSIIQKIYFPRLILPLSTTIVHLIDFGFAFLIFAGLMLYFKIVPSLVALVAVPLGILVVILGAAGLGLILSSLNIKYRDVRYALPFFVQILFFVTPVIYTPSILGSYTWLWVLNPMASVITTMRGVLIGSWAMSPKPFLLSLLSALILFILGVYVFNKTERTFADNV